MRKPASRLRQGAVFCSPASNLKIKSAVRGTPECSIVPYSGISGLGHSCTQFFNSAITLSAYRPSAVSRNASISVFQCPIRFRTKTASLSFCGVGFSFHIGGFPTNTGIPPLPGRIIIPSSAKSASRIILIFKSGICRFI